MTEQIFPVVFYPVKFHPGDMIVVNRRYKHVTLTHEHIGSHERVISTTQATILDANSSPNLVIASNIACVGRYYTLILTSDGRIGSVYDGDMTKLDLYI